MGNDVILARLLAHVDGEGGGVHGRPGPEKGLDRCLGALEKAIVEVRSARLPAPQVVVVVPNVIEHENQAPARERDVCSAK